MIRIFAGLLLLYVVLRALIVCALGDVFIYGEELEKGFVAQAILSGVDVPYAKLPYHPYEGGGFVASHVKAIAFLLVGPNVLAHKLAAIFWGALTLFAIVRLLFRHGGAGAALIGGLLVVLGPMHFQKESLLHLGIHYEALLFIALVLDYGLRVAEPARGDPARRRDLLILGLSAGFGTYFSYQVPLAVLSVIVLLALVDWKRIFSPVLMAATVAGLAPLLWMASQVGADVFDIHGDPVGATDGWRAFLVSLKFGLASPLASATVALGFIGLLAGVIFAPPHGQRMRAILLVGGFADLWMISAMATGMIRIEAAGGPWFQYLRFAPLVFACLVVVALGAGPAVAIAGELRSAASAKIARVAITIMIGIGAVHTARIIDEGQLSRAQENVSRLLDTRGTEARNALAKIAPRLFELDSDGRLPANAEVYAQALAPFVGADVGPLDYRVGAVVAGGIKQTQAMPDALLAAFKAALPDVHGDAIRVGLGSPLYHLLVKGDVRGYLSRADFHPKYAEALGRFGPFEWTCTPAYVAHELTLTKGTLHRDAYLRGLGHRVFRCAVMQPYWGPELVFRSGDARERLIETVRAEGASGEALASILEGYDECAAWFGG